MCGIAGIVSTQLNSSVLTERVAKMQHALRLRGPDDAGQISFSQDGNAISLAHTRLSIIDLSDKGHQPMKSENDRYTIVFNGEIYNYKSLKEDLEKQGERFDSESDTEVILKLYQHHGKNCLSKLRGMFAFFIWDNDEQQGFAARDPFGIKPLYFTQDKNSFAFASELRAVIKSELVTNALSTQGLYSYFINGSFAEPSTILDGVSQLPAGHSLTWINGLVQISEYAPIEFNSREMDNTEAIAITREALHDSVAAHLVSDVPVGIFLSGGIDSTAILALASKMVKTPISTYSIAFEEEEWNEGDIAKRIAHKFGSKHTEWVISRDIAQSLFNDFIDAIDQPTIDGFNTYCVAKLAHEHGAKVVLSGLGGDELFAGYKSFKLLPKMRSLSHRTRLLRGLYCLISDKFTKFLSARTRRILDFLSDSNSLKSAHQSLRGVFSKQEALALLKERKLSFTPSKPKIEADSNEQDKISQLELSTYMRNQLLRDSDVMSMAWGLELRVPLIDYKLQQTLAQVPAKLRLRYGKQLLIDSVPEIPEWVIERPKQGFRFPFDLWFQDHWDTPKIENMAPSWIKLKPWYRAWSLLVLKRWVQKNI